jgi:hypothetical protein
MTDQEGAFPRWGRWLMSTGVHLSAYFLFAVAFPAVFQPLVALLVLMRIGLIPALQDQIIFFTLSLAVVPMLGLGIALPLRLYGWDMPPFLMWLLLEGVIAVIGALGTGALTASIHNLPLSIGVRMLIGAIYSLMTLSLMAYLWNFSVENSPWRLVGIGAALLASCVNWVACIDEGVLLSHYSPNHVRLLITVIAVAGIALGYDVHQQLF